MPTLTLPMEGGCRCGRVRIRVSAPPLITSACHCAGCQRMSASAYSLSAAIPSEGFAVIRGETAIGGLHGPEAHHHFCPHCMTWMFTWPEGMDWFVNLRATMLDDTGWYRPFIETFVSEKLAFAETGAVRSYETYPPMEAFEGLLKEYAAWAGR
jgi:hypothetical protein